jgi:redox-sensitive bicupin YhaK (pirin superfamily)
VIDHRPAASRFVTRAEGRTTYHSFAFGAHYDPGNVGFAGLVAHNDEQLPPGTGYAEHPHTDVEVVTWVLRGALRHTSSVGSGVLGPGQVQRLRAGSGVVHSEVNDAGGETRFVQAWVRPDESGLVPAYAALDVPPTTTGWTTVAGEGGEVPVASRGTALHLASIEAGEGLALPEAPRLHVFVAEGDVLLGERRLRPGDTARMYGEGGRLLTGERKSRVAVWSFRGSAHPG